MAELELDAAVDHAPRSRRAPSGASSPASTLISSGSSASLAARRERAEHRAERLARVAPGEHLVLDEANRLAAAEASLRVVARGRRDRAGAHARERLA